MKRVPRPQWPPGAFPCRFCGGKGVIPLSIGIEGTHGRRVVAWQRTDTCAVCHGTGYEVIG